MTGHQQKIIWSQHCQMPSIWLPNIWNPCTYTEFWYRMLEYWQGARRMSEVPAYAWKLNFRLVINIHASSSKLLEKHLLFSTPEREATCNSCGNVPSSEVLWTIGTVAILFCRILIATSLRESYGPAWKQRSTHDWHEIQNKDLQESQISIRNHKRQYRF